MLTKIYQACYIKSVKYTFLWKYCCCFLCVFKINSELSTTYGFQHNGPHLPLFYSSTTFIANLMSFSDKVININKKKSYGNLRINTLKQTMSNKSIFQYSFCRSLLLVTQKSSSSSRNRMVSFSCSRAIYRNKPDTSPLIPNSNRSLSFPS